MMVGAVEGATVLVQGVGSEIEAVLRIERFLSLIQACELDVYVWHLVALLSLQGRNR